ncbi:MAG: SEL1-like repeat protein [Gammaproteobacteria bacterium]|nr:SEL1-like repeat protein [Gammaproteobacteria bacterium]
MKRLRHTKFLILLPLLLLLAPAVPAAEGDDPYVKLFKVQQGMAEKGDPLAEFYLGEMYQEGLGTKADLEQALVWYKRSAAKGNALAKKRVADIEREQAGADKAKQRAAERAREAADAKAREKAEADAKPKQKTETAKPKTDPKAKQKADAEAARLAKEEEEAKAQSAKKPEEDPAKREARRRAILEQVRRVQQERAKEGGGMGW